MIIIAIGANLPMPNGATPLDTCRAALTRLAALPMLRLHAASSWWQSDPVPPSGQPPYINGVATFEGSPDPASLMSELHSIEAAFGRARNGVNSSRTLDLDLIAVGAIVRHAPAPILPHPRAHLRAFVLAPLHEILPDWIHPELQRTVSSLLDDITDQRCVRL